MNEEEIFREMNQTVAEIRQSFDDDYDYRYADYDNRISDIAEETLRDVGFDKKWNFINESFYPNEEE